ncbi:MAG: BON domain-containing protein [Armatimonadota bacterium]|nr:BON domain-containing protein [Armatimonadota bacterium]MCX7776801.1 BON domain-containing protein [Armatimonadota bacterium]MDW8024597.1 BON domain-containing protein [Armatimonadota bacterium]
MRFNKILASVCTCLFLFQCFIAHSWAMGERQRYHIVKRGETLFSIARRYGVPLQKLREANDRCNTDIIRVGEKLVIPSFSCGGQALQIASPTTRKPLNASPQLTLKPLVKEQIMAPAQPKRVELTVGKSVTIRAQRLLSIHISNPQVADVVVMGKDLLAVVGKSAGDATLVVLDERGISTYDVIVKEALRVSAKQVASAISIPGIFVQVVDGTIILTGKVTAQEQKQLALTIARLFSPNVIDLLRVEEVERKPEKVEEPKKPSMRPEELEQLIGLKSVTVRQVGDVFVIEGEVESQSELERIQHAAQLSGTTVLNLVRLRVPSPKEIKELLGMPKVEVKFIRDCFVVTGEVDSDEQKRAIDQLEQLLGKRVLNFVQVVQPKLPELKLPETKPLEVKPEIQPDVKPEPKALPQKLKELIGIDTIEVIELGSQKVMLRGMVETSVERDRAVKIAQAVVGEGNVLDMLQVLQPQQLRVEAWVLEINREALRQLGVQHPEAITFGEVGDPKVGRVFTRISNIQSVLQMLISKNVARLLSAPSAVAASGKQAKFTVGGEIPIPMTLLGGPAAGVQTPLGTGVLAQGVEFRQYGIILAITGTIDHSGVIKLKLQTEVSAPVPAMAVNVWGAAIPGFRTRSYETELELKPGEGVVLAGLISSEDVQYWRRVPILSSIPVLGELFKSRRFEKRETELAIFVTPTIIFGEAAQSHTTTG